MLFFFPVPMLVSLTHGRIAGMVQLGDRKIFRCAIAKKIANSQLFTMCWIFFVWPWNRYIATKPYPLLINTSFPLLQHMYNLWRLSRIKSHVVSDPKFDRLPWKITKRCKLITLILSENDLLFNEMLENIALTFIASVKKALWKVVKLQGVSQLLKQSGRF